MGRVDVGIRRDRGAWGEELLSYSGVRKGDFYSMWWGGRCFAAFVRPQCLGTRLHSVCLLGRLWAIIVGMVWGV